MNWISAILSVYLLALALLPCADEAGCDASIDFARAALEATGGEAHDHGSGCADHCSPFCLCSCCQLTIRVPGKPLLYTPPTRPGIPDPPIFEPLSQGLTVVNNIWQPPRSC
ncbi:MAG: hypothetical protein KDC30_09175 [Saprospiraceae bacterium]|nr:hypothetical protein [Saprospiraceae bacterium]